MGIPANWTERHDSREWRDDAELGSTVIYRWDVPAKTTHAAIEKALPAYAAAPGTYGRFRPLLRHRRTWMDSVQQSRIVEAVYSEPTISETLERRPGYGILLGETTEEQVRLVKDKNGKYVHHEEEGKLWRVVSGDPYVWAGRVRLRLRWAASTAIYQDLYPKVDTVCSHEMFGARAGRLRMAGLHWTWSTTSPDIMLYDVLLEYNPDGWNEYTKVQKYVFKVRKVQVIDDDGNLVGNRYRDEGEWVADGDTKAYAAKKFDAIPWADLAKVRLLNKG